MAERRCLYKVDYLRETKAKTFCDSFDVQLGTSEKLYGGIYFSIKSSMVQPRTFARL